MREGRLNIRILTALTSAACVLRLYAGIAAFDALGAILDVRADRRLMIVWWL